MLPFISSGPEQGTWVSVNEWIGHTDNDAVIGVSASCLGWVSGHQDIGLVKVSSISCVFVSSLPSLPHQVIHFSPTSHMKSEFGLCCAWFILCFFTTKKKNFSFQSKMSFKIMFPVFIAYFYSLLTKSVLKDFLSLWSRPSEWVKQPGEEGLMATKTLWEITMLAASVNQVAITPYQGALVEMLGSPCNALTALLTAARRTLCRVQMDDMLDTLKLSGWVRESWTQQYCIRSLLFFSGILHGYSNKTDQVENNAT